MSARPPLPPIVLGPGDTAPWFRAAAVGGAPDYAFDTAAGRTVLMLFFGTASQPKAAAALRAVAAKRELFDDQTTCFFGVSCDAQDVAEGRIAQALPGIRYFLDHDLTVSRAYGAASIDGGGAYFPQWLLLDRTLRVIARFPIDASEAALAALKQERARPALPDWAPVALVPDVLEPVICRHLIELYEGSGGKESGFMREVDGKTVVMTDPVHKQRRDYDIDDEALQKRLRARVHRRLVPVIERVFQFRATRIERHVVACYAAGAGHFRPHRDNTTRGTAHRRFAVTINLNGGYEGGDLRFPEYGPRTYRAPVGGAVVFSCSLLHEATPVTSGVRYAYLPFLYDDEAARQREANNVYLGGDVGAYRDTVMSKARPAGSAKQRTAKARGLRTRPPRKR